MARFAHRTRIAKALGITKNYLPPAGTIVDFGAGTGSLLSALGDVRPDANLFAVEPYMEASSDRRLQYIKAFSELNGHVELVTAFEVCEHLSDEDTERFLTDARNVLHPGGKLIISVPIMVGGAFLLKKLHYLVFYRKSFGCSFSFFMKGVFGGTLPRATDRRFTHEGFDFRWLRRQIHRHFEIESEFTSPLPLPWWASSQIFFICRKR